MIKKIISTIIFFILIIIISNTITLGSYFINKNIENSINTKDIIMNIMPYLYIYGIDSKILYDGKYKATNKVDIVISNHINTIDFFIYLSLIRLFDTRPIYFLFRKNMILIPGFGFLLGVGNNIRMNRKIEDDIDNINNSINKIKEGIIILMPEGTRFTPEKFINAQAFSKNNNLPVFNNTLFPKMKGIFTIINILKKNNKLGNIIDFTMQVENFKNKKTYLNNLIMDKFGNTFTIINSYSIPHKVVDDYTDFKKWFLNKIWIKKDKILDNIHNTSNYKYKELIPSMQIHEYYIYIICITIFFYLTSHTNGYYIPISFILSYFIIFKLYRSK